MRRVALVLAGAALLLAACGGSSQPTGGREASVDEVLAAIRGLDGEARTQRLAELAEKEGGRLNLYTSLGADTTDMLVDAFEDAYDVDVAFYRADGDTILARLLEEEKAGFHGADAVQLNGLALTNLHDRGLLVPYSSPSRRRLIPGAEYAGWTAYQANPFVISWNTKLVRPGRRPRRWEDLADPRWKGQLALEADDVDWFKTLWDYWVKTEGKPPKEADRLFAAIGANAVVVKGHSLMGQLHAAGEFALAINYASRADILAAQGAPLAWRPAVEPLIVEPNGVALLRSARHPAAAVLFYDWVLDEGQKIIAEDHRDPVRRDLAVGGKAERIVVDFADLAAHQEEWRDRYDRILRRGRAAPAKG